MKEGPVLEDFMRYASLCPEIYFTKPYFLGFDEDSVHTSALVNDRLLSLGAHVLTQEESRRFNLANSKESIAYLKLMALLSYLLGYKWFIQHQISFSKLKKLIFKTDLEKLSREVEASCFVKDNDRREEICRMILLHLDLYPQGEDENLAKDRMLTLDSLEQARIITKSLEAQERAREIREALERKRAAEAASKMMRE
ncbi:MAG: hypothetical protein JXR70_10860 [Spirochaetales bacterium]|nr:hypothetical protein [Spirochaetales bacterium]